MNDPTTRRKSRRKLWGAHRRRHVRNETLTIVWNYTRTTVQSWYDRATATATEGPEAGIVANNHYRNLLTYWKDWLFGTTTTTTAPNSRSTTGRSSSSDEVQNNAAASIAASTSPSVEMQDLSVAPDQQPLSSPSSSAAAVVKTNDDGIGDGGKEEEELAPPTKEHKRGLGVKEALSSEGPTTQSTTLEGIPVTTNNNGAHVVIAID